MVDANRTASSSSARCEPSVSHSNELRRDVYGCLDPYGTPDRHFGASRDSVNLLLVCTSRSFQKSRTLSIRLLRPGSADEHQPLRRLQPPCRRAQVVAASDATVEQLVGPIAGIDVGASGAALLWSYA